MFGAGSPHSSNEQITPRHLHTLKKKCLDVNFYFLSNILDYVGSSGKLIGR